MRFVTKSQFSFILVGEHPVFYNVEIKMSKHRETEKVMSF